MLVLFDIDGTLLLSDRAGMHAMLAAGRSLIGEQFSFDGIAFSGRLDPRILEDATLQAGLAFDDDLHGRLRRAYAAQLAQNLAARNTVRALAGVVDLLAALAEETWLTAGVLTGNYPETGRLKIGHAGIDAACFKVAAWGDDGRERCDLPPVARSRHEDATGRSVAWEEIVVIGDTPNDIDCARANGCRVISVTTGPHDRAELAALAPDVLLGDLSDTARVVELLRGWRR